MTAQGIERHRPTARQRRLVWLLLAFGADAVLIVVGGWPTAGLAGLGVWASSGALADAPTDGTGYRIDGLARGILWAVAIGVIVGAVLAIKGPGVALVALLLNLAAAVALLPDEYLP